VKKIINKGKNITKKIKNLFFINKIIF